MLILIGEVVTKEGAGAAGMVAVVLGLVAIIRLLVTQRATRNGNGPPSKDDVKRIVCEATSPTEYEIIERNATRDRVAKLSRLATENAEHQKQMLITTHDMVRYTKESADNTAAILDSIKLTNSQNQRAWLAQDRTLEHLLQVDDRTKRIEDKLTQ